MKTKTVTVRKLTIYRELRWRDVPAWRALFAANVFNLMAIPVPKLTGEFWDMARNVMKPSDEELRALIARTADIYR